MSKKIGFRSYDEDRDKTQKNDHVQATVIEYLSQTYAPIGPTEAKCYKTIDELVYELSNICPVGRGWLSLRLSQAGYKVEFVAGVPYWVLYEKRMDF